MSDENASQPPAMRTRRAPPPMRPARVVAKEELSQRMLRLRLEGDGARELGEVDPAGSIRLLIPSPGSHELVIPEWDGNVWLLPDGERAVVRTFTPLRVDRSTGRLDLEVVRHPRGAVSRWAEEVVLGAAVAFSGPARGYSPDLAARRFVMLGDETALPAISQVLPSLPVDAAAVVHVEVVSSDAVLPFPERAGLDMAWHVVPETDDPGSTLVAAARTVIDIDEGTRIWAAGEAASMQALRKYFGGERSVPRSQLNIRGYWKAALPPASDALVPPRGQDRKP